MANSSSETAGKARAMLESNPLYDVALMEVTPWVSPEVLQGPYGELFTEMLVFAFLKGVDYGAKMK